MKKTVLLITTLLMLITLCIGMTLSTSAQDVIHTGTWGDLTWELNETTGHLTVSGEGEMDDFTESSTSAWRNNKASVKSVTVESGVTSIGGYAFCGCSSLTSVTISNSVTSIGIYAFADCSSLTSIAVPNSVTNMKGYAFLRCSSLTSVTLSNSAKSIGDAEFYGCSSLTSITIPDSVTSIGDYAFFKCSSLTSITMSNNVKSIGLGALIDCSNLKELIYCGTAEEWALLGYSSNSVVLHKYQCQSLNADNHKKTCSICNDEIEASHIWDNGTITTWSTHLTPGIKTYTCLECGEIKTEELAKVKTHTYPEEWSPHDAAQHKKTCECGEVTYDYHKWDRGVVNGNEKIFTCYDCGYTVAEQIAPVETTASVETTVPTQTTAPATSETTAPIAEKSGCSGSAMGSVSLLLLLPAAFALRKKKED